jgi:DNA segregation ATPase FtsK/SpoIIIE, S-DNA-T family
VASSRARIGQASALHRQAAAAITAAAAALDAALPAATDHRKQYDLAERLQAAADVLAPGWSGQPLAVLADTVPLGGDGLPSFIRVGTAQPLDGASFPVIVPLLGTGHLTLDADATDARVAGLLRALLVRLLAAAPAGSLLVRAVDAGGDGLTFTGFGPLADAGLLPPPAIDQRGLRAALTEAEQWVRPAATHSGHRRGRDRNLLLVVAKLPQPLDAVDAARIALLAEQGPTAGLHLVVAGWPPRSGETQPPPLTQATRITVRRPYASVADPPGGRYSAGSAPAGLATPVFLDENPPPQLVARLCHDLAARSAVTNGLRFTDLLPQESGHSDPTDGLAVTVGFDGTTPVTLRFNDLTPHWMVGGRPGSGKAAFLGNVLYGLCARYQPDDLEVYLIDCDGRSFPEFTPTEVDGAALPQLRAVAVEADREYALAVLRSLDDEMASRAAAGSPTGRVRFVDLRQAERLPRILCMIDEFPALLAGNDDFAAEAASRLASLARTGRSYGVHLILASQGPPSSDGSYGTRDPIFGQFPVRVALAGGGAVLDPSNDAAAGLPAGAAVVNTAGGFGGPRGAVRGHERTVRFPDPYADPAVLADLRHRLRAAERAA